MAEAARTGPPQRHDITGLVLAGGRGQRVGGRDKGLIEYHGVPLALQVLERLRPQVAGLLISANRNQEAYARWASVVTDAQSQRFDGPLAGIASAFAHGDAAWLAVVACDLPLLPTDTVARLANAVGAGAASHAAHDGRHALVCLLHRRTAGVVQQLLDAGERRIGALYAALHSVAVPFTAAELINLNAPGDLAAPEGVT